MTATSSHRTYSAHGANFVDFDLHGIVGVRILDATPDDVAKVERQLGPLRQPLDREPDITVRFVDSATTRAITYVGLGQSGFNKDGFFVLRGQGGVAAKALLPLQDISRRPVIVCERAMPAVPHLLAFINLTALSKGVLPLHASAFTTDRNGILVTGWAKSGKTESLLGFMRQGAKYVGDEWVYLTPDGAMLGVPEPIRLWAWHFDQFPDLLTSRPRRDQVRLSAWKRAARLAEKATGWTIPLSAIIRKGSPIVARQAYLQVPPAELFGNSALTLRGRIDAVVLVMSHESAETAVLPTSAGEVSARIAASLSDERADLMALYRQFCFAFPQLRNDVVDHAEVMEAALLADVLDRQPTAKVLHPYPCDITTLADAVARAADQALGVQRPTAEPVHPAASTGRL